MKINPTARAVVFLSEPGQTAYDINFSFFGFPVRVHPAFFVLPLLIGQNLVPRGIEMPLGFSLLIVAFIFFISVLIHELGHAVAFRYYGIPSRIVLYWMGGLAIPGRWSGSWGNNKRSGSLTSNQQIVVSLAGPIFGFLLAAALVGVVYLVRGSVEILDGGIPLPVPRLAGTIFDGSEPFFILIWSGIALNIFLNLFNLVPIYPLDGGQVARQVMIQMDPQDGPRNSIYLSIAVAVLLALFLFNFDRFLAIFMGFMAWSNYQTLQRFNRPW